MVANKNDKGYTLIEMMIVISIIGILSTIALPNMQRALIRARETTLRQNLFVMRDVIDQYYGDHGKYPDSLDNLVDENYIRHVPMDPITATASSWISIPPDSYPRTGVFDVHSGSYKVGLNGVPYNEW